MCNVKLLNHGTVVDEFSWPECILQMLSFYQALGYELDIVLV
jgi:hypothetical protein